MERGTRKEFTGVVVSDKMQKTRVVSIETWKVSPKYKKRVHATRRVKAHDEENVSKVGDTVRMVESKPLSADKRWRITEVVGGSAPIPGGDQA
ncbi:MAG: 30S ribosomal protein S17 [Bacillota bacterium]